MDKKTAKKIRDFELQIQIQEMQNKRKANKKHILKLNEKEYELLIGALHYLQVHIEDAQNDIELFDVVFSSEELQTLKNKISSIK